MPTLLVADDNRLSRELIRDLLGSASCRIVEACDGREALDRLEAANPDLVLLDLEMPVKDGFAVLAEIRRNPRFRSIPVAAVTARAMQSDRDRILAAGFDACITKPIQSTELRERVRGLLSARKGTAL
jgi:CheY-like chemotaxis protein